MKKIFSILFFIILLILFILFWNYKEEIPNNHILYSWNLEDIKENEQKFEQILKDYHITTIYQDFTSEYFENVQNDFIKQMSKEKIDIYHLAGDPSWGRENGFLKIAGEIDKLEEYNQKVPYKIKGIVLDIEPYVSEKEEKFAIEDFEIYVKEIKKSYRYIQDKNLELILAIPYWFDHIDIALLESLIQNADGISIMNYSKNKTIKNMKEEWSLAKKYQKQINTIYEIEYDKEDYFSSKEEIEKDFNKIKNAYQDYPIDIAYHHYKSMK